MNEIVAPDLSWAPAELLGAALAAHELSAAWFAPLAALDRATLSAAELMALAVVTHRLLGVAEALALGCLAAVPTQRCGPDTARTACRGGPDCAHHWEADEFSVMTRESLNAVRRRQHLARQLAGPPPSDAGPAASPVLSRALPLLASGRVNAARVTALARALNGRDASTCEAVLDRVLPKMPDQTPPAFAKAVQRAVSANTSPTEAAAAAHAARRTETGIRTRPLDHGLAAMTVTAPVEQVEAVLSVLRSSPAGTEHADQTGTTGQLQVSRLLNLVLHDASCTDRRPASRPGVGVIVTVAAEVLAGLSNEPGLVGTTPVHAELIRQLVEEQGLFFRLALLDHRGVATSLGRSQRFASPRQRIAVGAKSPTCIFPGCQMPAAGCEIDHLTAWRSGGRTDLADLNPFCARHHHLKHQAGGTVHADEDGRQLWTLPGGYEALVDPCDHRPPPGRYDWSAPLSAAAAPAVCPDEDPTGVETSPADVAIEPPAPPVARSSKRRALAPRRRALKKFSGAPRQLR